MEKVNNLNVDEITYREISDPTVLAKKPVVSVKMLTYNHEPYIAQAIEGVLMQETDFPIELLIGEDCSTDRTRSIVMEYQKKRPDIIRVIAWERNTGARNNSRKTNELLRGKYIAWCEGDDYWHHPLKLQKQVDIMEANPDIGLVHGATDRYNVVTGKRFSKYYKPVIEKGSDLFTSIIEGKYLISTFTVCMRLDIYRSIQNDNPDSFVADFLMGDVQTWLEASRITKFAFIDDSLGTYNLLPESATHSKDINNITRQMKSGFRMRLHFIKKYNCALEIERAFRMRYYNASLRTAFVYQNRELAVETRSELIKAKGSLSLLQWFLYLGAINSTFHFILMPLTALVQKLRIRFRLVLPH